MTSSFTPMNRRTQVLTTFHFLRQQMDKPAGQFNHCLADFIAPKPASISSLADYLGAFAVTAGFGVDDLRRSSRRTMTITTPS